jgi:flagellar motor switch protein FliN/FliY
MGELTAQYPVALWTRLKEGGGIAVLLTMEAAAKVAPAEQSEEGGGSAPDETALNDLAEAALGSGARILNEKLGSSFEPERFGAAAEAGKASESVAQAVGEAAVLATFDFSADPDITGEGALVFSQPLEDAVPENLTDLVFGEETEPEAAEPAKDEQLSDHEMERILSDFDDKGAVQTAAARETAKGRSENLDIVLDIQLTVTARLGRVEMPISEILELGPGSILEVGHLVDEPIELLINDKLIARGDVVVVDEKFGLRITEIVSAQERIESLR